MKILQVNLGLPYECVKIACASEKVTILYFTIEKLKESDSFSKLVGENATCSLKTCL